MKSRAILLSRALASLDRDGLIALAEKAGVTARVAFAAFNDRPVSVDNFLRLCAVVGLDPVTEKKISPRPPAPFDRKMLAVFVLARRVNDDIGNVKCARKIGIDRGTLFRIESEIPVTVESTFKACVYADVHPFDLCEPVSGTPQKERAVIGTTVTADAPLT